MRGSRLLVIGAVVAAGVAAWFLTQDDHEPTIVQPPRLVAADAEFDNCFECHQALDASIEAGRVSLIGFGHEEHFKNSGDIGCGNCHTTETHDQTPPRTPGMDECFYCHADEGAAPKLPCLRCHDALTVSPPQSHFASAWSGEHGSGTLLSSAICETCHSKPDFCNACHGVEIPHEDGWSGSAHAVATFEQGIQTCENCHERGPQLAVRDDCDRCHHPQNQEVPRWRDAHPPVVREGGATTCFSCHSPDTCIRCHTTGEEDISADYGRLGGEESPVADD